MSDIDPKKLEATLAAKGMSPDDIAKVVAASKKAAPKKRGHGMATENRPPISDL